VKSILNIAYKVSPSNLTIKCYLQDNSVDINGVFVLLNVLERSFCKWFQNKRWTVSWE